MNFDFQLIALNRFPLPSTVDSQPNRSDISLISEKIIFENWFEFVRFLEKNMVIKKFDIKVIPWKYLDD